MQEERYEKADHQDDQAFGMGDMINSQQIFVAFLMMYGLNYY
jgi:hypothetical protein